MTGLPTCRVAILGATGHVGKCLVAEFSASPTYELGMVVRDREKAQRFAETVAPGTEVLTFDELGRRHFDVAINCVGVGTPQGVAAAGATIFELTEAFDAVVFDYLAYHPESRVICLSSGAAYGGDFAEPAGSRPVDAFSLDAQPDADPYGAAKAASERRHRAAGESAIVDLRLFSLFSRYVDLEARFFMSDVVKALLTGDELVVSPDNIARDYVSPADLAALVSDVISAGLLNDVFDVYSAAPVRKFEILERFRDRFGLSYRLSDDAPVIAPTGSKPNYYSVDRHAESIGYRPTATSLETLEAETEALISAHGALSRDGARRR